MDTKELNRLLGIALLIIGILQIFSWFLSITEINKISNYRETVSIEQTENFSKIEPVIIGNEEPILKKPRLVSKNTSISNYFVFFLIFNLLTGIILIAAGFGILKLKSFSKQLGLIASILSLFITPVGTLTGIFGIWFLTSKYSNDIYSVVQETEIERNSIT